MPNHRKLLLAALLFLAASPAAANGGPRSCAGLIGSVDDGGLVTQIIRASGVLWWVEQFARARPCG